MPGSCRCRSRPPICGSPTPAGDRSHALEFAFALHRAVAPEPALDVCLAPFSVACALRLVAAGARGITRDELVALLLGDVSGDLDALGRLHVRAGRLSQSDADGEQPVLAVSDTLWVDRSITINESFADEVGSVRPAPFRDAPDRAQELINADVAKTTRDLIRELVPPGAITEDTVAALVNALYLRCAWLYPFAEHATRPRPFHTPDGPVDLPTMELIETVEYARVGPWQVVRLPAAGGVRAVVLLLDRDLPAETKRAAEAELDGSAFEAMLDTLRPTRVRLRLPRLRLSLSIELTGALERLGVRTVFTDRADLSGISPDPLAVQQVLHDTVLKVDEQGLEGAAATAVMFALTGMMPVEQPVPVDVDRPFLLLIEHAATGVVYFMARVVTPR
ncbi:MAG TPA: serpin family protein [Actinophytocola sp.]|uniref:serpin family protein n=1 Tax=Actinophytocola sp. TaxID=1872138 RepID=UPI002DBCC568|nr:serpin family protein [Actinophytocola sp.]HEU5474392.1 serpin family protein [Actinophytocola sp.]